MSRTQKKEDGGQGEEKTVRVEGLGKSLTPGGSARKLRGQTALPAVCPEDNDHGSSHFPNLHL